jgi:hypothetical protein
MSDLISQATRARFGASIVALAPAVMLAGLFAHPYIATLPDEAAVAETATADTTRWGLVHLTVGVASGLLVLAFLDIRSYLRGRVRTAGASWRSRSSWWAARCSRCCRAWSSEEYFSKHAQNAQI